MNSNISRRDFIQKTAIASATPFALALSRNAGYGQINILGTNTEKPALLGGKPVRAKPFPSWPIINDDDRNGLLGVLNSGKWFRGYGQMVSKFEKTYAEFMGAKYCVATANGTSALFASLAGIDISPGDEVILPPYTFIATLNVILLQYALPIFVDTDPDTFQIDAKKIESAITPQTRAILPVHIGGAPADMDTIMATAKKHNLPVIEDACQAHLAEWRGKKVGTIGSTGCFSFQASKNLNSGEGGAILSDDEALIERCYSFHTNGRARKSSGYNFLYSGCRGANLRLTEFQAALLLSQMTRLEAQSKVRDENGTYLVKLLSEIPGIKPAKLYSGCTRNAWHLFMFRYQKEHFANLPRSRFLAALNAEGIPCSGGYSPLNKEESLKQTLISRGFKRIYGDDIYSKWLERNQCPENDKLCQEAVWFTQTMLLGSKSDMEDIAAAIWKIHKNADKLTTV